MTKKEFIQYYSIADAEPIDPSRRALPAEAFSAALIEFMENRFPSVVRVSCEKISAQSVLLCAEYVAAFFKSLITYVYGRAVINIDIVTDNDHLILYITADGGLPITDSELRSLVKLARNGGFEFYLTGDSIKLTASFSPTAVRRVYAVNIVDGRGVMLGKLVEIFCYGDLINPDPPPPRPMPEPIRKRTRKRKTAKTPDSNG